MTELSDKLNYEREVIRVWFCNKRQALKNTIKKLKASETLHPKDEHLTLKNSIVVCSQGDLTS
jgi:class 6 POU domain transcription factor